MTRNCDRHNKRTYSDLPVCPDCIGEHELKEREKMPFANDDVETGKPKEQRSVKERRKRNFVHSVYSPKGERISKVGYDKREYKDRRNKVTAEQLAEFIEQYFDGNFYMKGKPLLPANQILNFINSGGKKNGV